MLSVQKAFRIVLRHSRLTRDIACPLEDSVGKILRENIYADRPYPPFDKALMDGIAISYKSWKAGVRSFRIENIIPAGVPLKHLNDPACCVKIMTGAVVPREVDCIIPIERVKIKNDTAYILDQEIHPGQYIRRQGMDIEKGGMILKKGIKISPAHVGAIASVGKRSIKVSKSIRIMLVVTGDELVDVGVPIRSFQTRFSNAYALSAALESTALAVVDFAHVNDDIRDLRVYLKRSLEEYDLVVLSGGVSKGDYDHIPSVLKDLEVKAVFHGVNQKPGKPLWFGISKDKRPVFALPGNPVSSLLCAYRYIIPFLYSMAGGEYLQCFLNLDLKIPSHGTIFLPVAKGKVLQHGGSGDIVSWAHAEGFIEYDQQDSSTLRPYFSWRI